KSIPDKIAHSSSEKHRVCKYFALAVACDRYVTFFSDQFIKLRNLFNRVTTVEKRSLNLLLRSISTSEKQQVVDDGGEFFTFGHTRFDNLAILVRSSCPRQCHFSFTTDIGDRCPQFMRKITRKL